MKKVWSWIGGLFKKVTKTVGGYYKSVKEKVAGYYKTVKKVVASGYKMVKKTVAAGYKWVTKTLPGHYEAAKRWVKDKVEAVKNSVNSTIASTVNKIGIALPDAEFSITNPFTATTYKWTVSQVVNPGSIVVGPNSITAEDNGVLGKYDFKGEAGIELSPFEGKLGTYVLEGGIGNYSQLYMTPEIGNDYFGMKAGLGSECRGLFDQTHVEKYVFATKPTSVNNTSTELAFTVTKKPVEELRNQAVAAVVVVGGIAIVIYGVPAAVVGGVTAIGTKVLEWLCGPGSLAIP